jgi:hypothetical protein
VKIDPSVDASQPSSSLAIRDGGSISGYLSLVIDEQSNDQLEQGQTELVGIPAGGREEPVRGRGGRWWTGPRR